MDFSGFVRGCVAYVGIMDFSLVSSGLWLWRLEALGKTSGCLSFSWHSDLGFTRLITDHYAEHEGALLAIELDVAV